MRALPRLVISFCFITAMAASPAQAVEGDYKPDELRATPYCGVYHFDRDKVRNGRELNETPSCLGGTLGWNINETWDAGVMVNSFRNSIYKRTVIAGIYAEKDLYQNAAKDGILDACGLGGVVGGQLVKGYDTPVIGEVYGYCEKWRLRANVTVVPPVGADVDAAVIWSAEVKLWEW